MRIWRMVTAAGRELEMRASSRDLKEDSLIPVVSLKPSNLRKSQPIPVERDDFVELVGVTGDTQLHRIIMSKLDELEIS
jgi:hypothetical protein